MVRKRVLFVRVKRSYTHGPMSRDRGFGIYVHFPFCRHRCSYCDFFSSTDYDEATFAKFGDSLIREIRRESPVLKSRFGDSPVTSIFWGGGTPSLFPSAVLEKVLEALSQEWTLNAETEITIEVNPETVTQDKAASWKTMGINRLSLGVQSTSQSYLEKLDRRVSASAIPVAVKRIKSAGFDNFSCDLIFAIPGQSESEMLVDLDVIAALGPRHISSYNLTLKPGHALFSQLPSEDVSADLYEAVIRGLASRGYKQYEISNFAKPGSESRHNLLYWSGGDFVGFGPSAASRFFSEGRFFHRKNIADLKQYSEGGLGAKGTAFEETSESQTVLESLFLELRKNEGIGVADFTARYGFSPISGSKFSLFKKEGLVDLLGSRLRLTDKGRLLADSVTSGLMD